MAIAYSKLRPALRRHLALRSTRLRAMPGTFHRQQNWERQHRGGGHSQISWMTLYHWHGLKSYATRGALPLFGNGNAGI